MNEPTRLLEGEGTAFERALLGAMAAERPSRTLQGKMRLGLGLVGVGAVTKSASASFQKFVLAGAVAVGLAAGGVALVKRATPQRPAILVPAPAALAVPAKPASVEPAPVLTPPRAATEAELAPRALPVRRETKVTGIADLREEIRLLDQARAAVRTGSSGRALRVLAKYEQKFPRGQFRQEVDVLRMEALAQSGNEKRAAALAKQFLAEHPNSPHVERVEHVGK